jgi:beta-phosphoglucomutase-like phosphatase (HAD superfamily)
MKYKAILFDMDGVLVLSEPLHYKAWQHVVDEFSKDQILSEEDIIGVTDLSIAKEIIARTHTRLSVEELYQKKKVNFLQLLGDDLPTVDGRNLFLNTCINNTQMAVVSSSSREEIGAVLQAANISAYFKFYLGFEDTLLHKPDPEPYLKAMNLLQCIPQDTLIIEDSPAGVESAKKSGADVVGIDSSGLLYDNLDIRIFRDFYGIEEWLNFRWRNK